MTTRALLAAILALAGAVLALPSAAFALAPCDKYAATTGSDSNTGSATDPYATVPRLVTGLSPGETGCVRGPGQYTGDVVVNKQNVTIRSEDPRTFARITGQVKVGALGTGTELMALEIDGTEVTGKPVVQIIGSDARVIGNEIYADDQLSCLYTDVTTAPYGAGVVIEGNRIRNCNAGLSLERTPDAMVLHNTIFSMVQGGIELYPNADGSTIANNTIVGNQRGVLFAGDGATTSDSNTVEANVITDSASSAGDASQGNLARSWGGGPVGTGNKAVGNCLDGTDGNVYQPPVGFTVTGTKPTGDPRYVNPAAHDYTLQSTSACKGLGVLPGVVTGSATGVTQTTATLSGTVNPHFQSAQWYFEYGPFGAFSNRTPVNSIAALSVPTDVSAGLASLVPGVPYSYRLVARQPSGVTEPGDPATFTTQPGPDPTPTPTPTVTPTPTPDPDPDDDNLVAPADKCPTVPAGRYDTNDNGCPGPQPVVKARYDVVSSQRRPRPGGGIDVVKVLHVDLRGVEKGAKISVRCRGKGACRTLKASGKRRKRALVRVEKGLPKTIRPKSVLVVRVTKRGKAGRFFELKLRFKSVGWRQSRTGCIPIGTKRLASMQACRDQRP